MLFFDFNRLSFRGEDEVIEGEVRRSRKAGNRKKRGKTEVDRRSDRKGGRGRVSDRLRDRVRTRGNESEQQRQKKRGRERGKGEGERASELYISV